MHHYEIKSKAYHPTGKKENILIIVINCAIILLALTSVFLMLVNGVSINNVSGCILSIVFGVGLRRVIRKRPEYIFCVLQISIDTDQISISYYPYVHRKIYILVNDIETLQYSDQLKCLRITGKFTVEENKNPSNSSNELLLYIDCDKNREFYDDVKSVTHKAISYVDR